MDGVSKPATDSKPVRMFVALDLPETVREDIAAWGEAELADPALRPVPPESLHVTLAFLGNRPLSRRRADRRGDRARSPTVPVLLELGEPGRAAQRAAGRASFALPALLGRCRAAAGAAERSS